MTSPRPPSFAAHPFVCGAVGHVASGDLERLVAASPATRVLADDPAFVLRARGPVRPVGAADAASWRWGALLAGTAGPGHPSETLLCAGASRDGDRWTLHGDGLGIQPLYRRSSGRGFLFATRIDPLVRAVPGRVHADWEAWSTIVLLGSPLGAATPFEEVHRFDAGEMAQVGGDGSVSSTRVAPSWLSATGAPQGAAGIAAAVGDALPGIAAWRRPPAVTLSGGWDSRLLAALSRRRYRRRPRAWTTATDDGRDLDVELAHGVAGALGLPHRVVMPARGGWAHDAAEARERVEFQTWYHPWFMPLARRLHRSERSVMLGLGGGIVLSGHFMDREVVEAGGWRRQAELLFGRFSGGVTTADEVWSPEGGPAIAGTALEAFHRAAGRFSDLEHRLPVAVLHLRTARAITLLPTALVAPEVEVCLPYLDSRVLHTTLPVPPGERLDGALTRAVMAHAAPSVAGLPSTNDAGPSRRGRRRRLASPRARSWMAGLIGEDAVARPLVAAGFLERALDPSPSVTRAWGAREARVVQGLSLLAQWRARYDDVLDPADGPGWG